MTDQAMQDYYAQDKEHSRLDRDVGLVEFARTVEVVSRTLPAAPAVVADIGGGPGRYTDWLVDLGHRVVHRDVVPLHVDHVRARHGDALDTALGDARALDLADHSVDALLLLGPLYHLAEEADRIAALREARRVVRPGGMVYVAAIARWSARLHGMLVQRLHTTYPNLDSFVEGMERTGQMPPITESGFTGFAHTPEQLRAEVDRSGLELQGLVALEGISFALADLGDRMADPDERRLVMDTLRAVESEPSLVGLGPHLLVSARAPG